MGHPLRLEKSLFPYIREPTEPYDLEKRSVNGSLQKSHRRYYQIAGITIQVDSDLPITDSTFHRMFKLFEADGPGEDTITLRHHFFLPDWNGRNLGKEVYRKAPWAIYKKGNSWIYVSPEEENKNIRQIAVFNHDYSKTCIYNGGEETFRQGSVQSLTLFPTDQILLARVLADRQGCYLHASGGMFDEKGLLFVGHSGAGKSTLVAMIKEKAEILCDDRIIVRGYRDGFKIYGTWSHGEVPEVSASSASLKAVFFLKKARENRLIPLADKPESIGRLLGCLIKPFVTADWWDKMLPLVGRIVREVPCYILCFDKSKGVIELLRSLQEDRE
jgi:hypothetical protein